MYSSSNGSCTERHNRSRKTTPLVSTSRSSNNIVKIWFYRIPKTTRNLDVEFFWRLVRLIFVIFKQLNFKIKININRARPRLQIIGSPRGAAEKFDANRVIGFAFFWSGQNRVLFLVTRLPRLLLMPTFCPLKCGIFHGIPAKDSGGATIEDAPVVVECKKNRNLLQGQCRNEHVQCP